MKVDIAIIRQDTSLDCYEVLIAMIGTFYQRSYEMMFVGSWGFKCDRQTKEVEGF